MGGLFAFGGLPFWGGLWYTGCNFQVGKEGSNAIDSPVGGGRGAGHIGYGIRKEYRGRGYATAALSLALDEARKIVPEDEIYRSVRKDNPASLKVQLRNGARVDYESGEEYFTRIPLSRQP